MAYAQIQADLLALHRFAFGGDSTRQSKWARFELKGKKKKEYHSGSVSDPHLQMITPKNAVAQMGGFADRLQVPTEKAPKESNGSGFRR